MKVKIVCTRDNETKEVELPMDEDQLLKIQGSILDRDTIGYITGADVTNAVGIPDCKDKKVINVED